MRLPTPVTTRPVGYIGPSCSSECEAIAYIGGFYGIPQISYACTSDFLTVGGKEEDCRATRFRTSGSHICAESADRYHSPPVDRSVLISGHRPRLPAGPRVALTRQLADYDGWCPGFSSRMRAAGYPRCTEVLCNGVELSAAYRSGHFDKSALLLMRRRSAGGRLQAKGQRRGRCSLCSKGPAPIRCRMFWYSYTNFEGVKGNLPVIYF